MVLELFALSSPFASHNIFLPSPSPYHHRCPPIFAHTVHEQHMDDMYMHMCMHMYGADTASAMFNLYPPKYFLKL